MLLQFLLIVSGSGDVDLKGRTKDFECSISGSGDINCGGLQSENATVKVSGSGNVHVFASVHLESVNLRKRRYILWRQSFKS